MSTSSKPKTVKVGPYTFRELCAFDAQIGSVRTDIQVAGPAGFGEAEWSSVYKNNTDDGNRSFGNPVPASGYVEYVVVDAYAGSFTRAGGTVVVRSNSGVMVQLEFSAVADYKTKACHVWGTATTAARSGPGTGDIHGRTVDLNLSANRKKTVKVGPYTFQETCTGDAQAGLHTDISVTGPAGFAETEYSVVLGDSSDGGNRSFGYPVSASGHKAFVRVSAGAPPFARAGGALTVRSNAGVMAQLDFSATVDYSAKACHVWGTATTGR